MLKAKEAKSPYKSLEQKPEKKQNAHAHAKQASKQAQLLGYDFLPIDLA